jgi:undecaprenyl-diphosphatase
MSTWQVILLGLIEGLTEFIPVSSTGHLLLAGHFLNFQSPGKTFEVLIQLGAILAILSVYAAKLMRLLVDFFTDARSRRFVLAVLIAFLPAMVIGAAAHKFIKSVLFETPWLICVTLIVGGVVLLAVDKIRLQPRYHDVMDLPISTALRTRSIFPWAQRGSARTPQRYRASVPSSTSSLAMSA